MTNKCNTKVFENGIQVFLTHTLSAKDTEKWVQAVAKLSGQQVDWHYFGGRAVIKALGNIEKVMQALKDLRTMHDNMYRIAAAKFIGPRRETDEMIKGIWQYNGLDNHVF